MRQITEVTTPATMVVGLAKFRPVRVAATFDLGERFVIGATSGGHYTVSSQVDLTGPLARVVVTRGHRGGSIGLISNCSCINGSSRLAASGPSPF